MMSNLVLFIGVSALVICTPGPDTALTIRNTLSGGRRHGVWTAAGVASGQLVRTVAAGIGLAGLVQTSRPAFEALKLAGAVYLVSLGVRSLWAAWRGELSPPDSGRTPSAASSLRALRQGWLSNLANPKMAAFFLSLLPQFAPSGRIAAPLALGTVFCLMTLGWLAFCAPTDPTGKQSPR